MFRILLVIICLLIVCAVALTSYSFARYVAGWDGNLRTDVAQWKIKINGVSVSDNADAAKVNVKLVPEGGDPENPGKIKAGQSGYFDVVIDPAGTEVSVSYTVSVDMARSVLPNGMTLDVYSQSGLITLPDSGIFNETYAKTVKFKWTWADVGYDDYADYKIVVVATVTQYCGEKISLAGGAA